MPKQKNWMEKVTMTQKVLNDSLMIQQNSENS